MFLKKKGSSYLPTSTASHTKYLTPQKGNRGYNDVLGWSDKGEKKRNDIIYKELMEEIKTVLQI